MQGLRAARSKVKGRRRTRNPTATVAVVIVVSRLPAPSLSETRRVCCCHGSMPSCAPSLPCSRRISPPPLTEGRPLNPLAAVGRVGTLTPAGTQDGTRKECFPPHSARGWKTMQPRR